MNVNYLANYTAAYLRYIIFSYKLDRACLPKVDHLSYKLDRACLPKVNHLFLQASYLSMHLPHSF